MYERGMLGEFILNNLATLSLPKSAPNQLATQSHLSGTFRRPHPPIVSQKYCRTMRGVLPYKWEAYCSTNGKCTVGFPFLQGLEARKVQRYKWGAYCRTNWSCTAILYSRPVRVGVSETLNLETEYGFGKYGFKLQAQ